MPNRKIVPEIRYCPWCQGEFEVGGRYRPKKAQIYCSRQCQAYARVKHADARDLSVPEAAYIAGLIDGEGSIGGTHRNARGRTSWFIRVYNTHRGVMEWLLKATNTGNIVNRPKEKPHHKKSYAWECFAWNAKHILEQALPYMIIKRPLAERVIKELESIKHRQSVVQDRKEPTQVTLQIS